MDNSAQVSSSYLLFVCGVHLRCNQATVSSHVSNMDSGIRENFGLSRPESLALESIIQHKESGILVTIRMRNLSATDRESGIHRVVIVRVSFSLKVRISAVAFLATHVNSCIS